jgi:hypothetical protein
MKKFIILLAGTMFVFGATLCPAATIPKQEKQAPIGAVPKQNTIHIGKEEKDKKDAPAAKTETKAPAAPDQKAVIAEPPAPADTKAPAKATKKAKKAKKTKKTKNN